MYGDDCVNMQVSQDWPDYEDEYYVYDNQGEYVTSTFKFVGAALLIACMCVIAWTNFGMTR